MRYLLALILISFQLFAYSQGQAQSHCDFQSISATNGLPSNYVFSLCEDENSFLWAGTDKGLCRYNGFNWQVWDKDNGLPGNYIANVLSDKRGGLWLDISEKGLFHFNIATGITEKVIQGVPFIERKLAVDTNGNLFRVFPSIKGDGYEGTFLSPFDLSHLITVFKIRDVPGASLQIDLPSQTLFYIYEHGRAINMEAINSENWKIKYWELPQNLNSSSIYMCNDSVIITNSHYYKFTKDKKLISNFSIFDSNNTYAYSTVTKNGYYIYNIKTGYYFIDNAGINEFHNSKCGLGSDFINYVYEMHDGTILFATLGAGLEWKKKDYQKSFQTGKAVRAIIKDSAFWYVVAGSQLFSLEDRSNNLSHISEVRNSSVCILKSDDKIFIGSLNGIEFYKFKRGWNKDHLLSMNAGISSILKMSKGFIASTYGNGLISFDEITNNVTFIKSTIRIIEKAIPLSYGYALLSYEDGVEIVDTLQHTNIHLTRKENLLSNSVHDVHQKGDTLWIATRNGVNVFTAGKIIKNISYHEGFVGDKAMYCFHYDKKLWVVSDKYLHLYDGNALRAITSYQLLPSVDEHVITALFNSQDNSLAVGSEKSITIIKLANVSMHTNVAVPRILRVIVDGRIESTQPVKVPYQFNKIVFDIAPYASSPLTKGTFLYKLIGLDQDWLELKDSLAISYAALRPGDYTLVAKIINSDGYAGRETVIASFRVNKPFWQKAWFFFVLLIATVLLTLFIVQQISKRRLRKFQAELLLQQSLQEERERISKDLHDHLGSNLVTMVAQVDNIETKLKTGSYSEASRTTTLLSSQAREVMTVLRETIWAVQENEHSLSSFVIRIRTFLQRLFDATGITWHVKVLEDDEITLSPKQTLQLFRIVQESSQNILKHSHASEANYTFHATKKNLSIHITDNGKGFSGSREEDSNGLYNIEQRVIVLGGIMTFASDGGVIIKIEIPLITG